MDTESSPLAELIENYAMLYCQGNVRREVVNKISKEFAKVNVAIIPEYYLE